MQLDTGCIDRIPDLIQQSLIRTGHKPDDIPQRSAVELIARELGAISEL